MISEELDVSDDATVIALVVEDNKRVLEAKTHLLQDQGFVTVGVENYHDAVREFRSIPRVDCVVTDINLPTDKRYAGTDTSGATLAQVLRTISTDLPIYGYSAVFAEGQLSEEMSDAFTAYYPKGRLTPDQQLEHAREWKQAAIQHRDQRLFRAQQDLERLRLSYKTTDRDFSTLRDLVPGGGPSTDIATVEEVLARAGYRVKLIEPGGQRPRIEGATATTRGPIVLWIKDTGNITVAEVYGYPELYGHGESETRAITDVLLLMDGYLEDLRHSAGETLGPEILRLRDYLVSVLGV
jgi:CheY-like chemotaxis protein